ncbi:MAG: class II histone deacetylase [Alphaproteobacteria bacterium]|nr:MAG: class II histone deacetylase [Alphaproteobacteria bacterium]
MSSNRTSGFVFHELYMWHDTGSASSVFPAGLTIEPGEHAENPDTKRRFRNLLEVSGLLERLSAVRPRPATEDEIARFHTRDYIARIKKLSAERGGDAGDLTPFGAGSFEIAQLAAGGTIRAVESVLSGEIANAYALVRPPGHHAERDRGRGFCIFGNVAIAVMHARAVHGVGRVATVDWDVHHGNGTQQAFYDDPEVLTISIHQDRLFPTESGKLDEIGEGRGRGYNLNIPMPPGSGAGAYIAAFERVIAPALRKFKPELIVVPSGFDAGGVDPLGRMMVHSACYRRLTRILMEVADEVCGGRLVLSHEGGYSAANVPYCGLAVMEELSGISTGVQDPWLPSMEAWGQQDLQPHQEAAIDRAAALLPAIK